ncbi:MAG: AAA family ATPase [Methylococcales bacterium]|nr:AAA family ATPase [Methylococcales bacterium]
MKTKYFYMMGSSSNIGKTTLCEGLLLQLLIDGYQPEQLAYIKPITQCIEKQAVSVFCENNHIAHQSIGSLVFTKGFTKNFIDGLSKTSDSLLKEILAEISQISENKAIVIIDGIGGPSTGSVVGVSNVDIARSLAAPVLFIGKPGIGSAIDDTILAVNFMQQGGIKNIALVYNKIESSELVSVKHYLSTRLAELLPRVPVLDFIPIHTQLNQTTKLQSASKISQWFNSQLFD